MHLIIISYNTKQITSDCIKSAYGNYPNISITVVDNNSKDGTQEYIRKNYPQVKLIENHNNLGYAKAVNIGMKDSTSEINIISNSDVFFQKDSIQILEATLLSNDNIAVCGPQQLYPDGTWQYSFGVLPSIKLGIMELFYLSTIQRKIYEKQWQKNNLKSFSPGYLDGAVLAVKSSAFKQVGGFDEDYFFYSEEADFCTRIKKSGFVTLYVPDSVVIHLRGGSSGHFNINEKKAKMFIDSKLLYCEKHLSKFEKNVYHILEIKSNFIKLLIWKVIKLIKNDKKSANKLIWYKELLQAWLKAL